MYAALVVSGIHRVGGLRISIISYFQTAKPSNKIYIYILCGEYKIMASPEKLNKQLDNILFECRMLGEDGLYGKINSDREGLINNLSKGIFDISSSSIEILPVTVCHLDITTLLVHSNRLRFIPDAIGELKNLERLYLYKNQLTTLPESIAELTNLKTLYLSDNKLITLPESFGELKNLEELYLSYNQLTTLPESFGELKNLEELYLSYNQLTTLPESFAELKNLEELYINDDQRFIVPYNLENSIVIEYDRNCQQDTDSSYY